MPKKSVVRTLKTIRAVKPKSPEDFEKLGLKLRRIGEGLFREGYKIVNADMVIKFPKDTEGIKHSLAEVRRIHRLMKFKILRRHLPEILYFDKASGVLIMRYYPRFRSFEVQADAMGEALARVISSLTRTHCSDLHTENVRSSEEDDAVIIDLGY